MDRLIERDQTEFGRSVSFFDAIFALSMTLLVTTLGPGDDAFASWGALWDSVGYQLVAFFISFTVVGSYWWGNHRLVGRLDRLSGRFVFVNLVMLAFVALLPFTTNALGDAGGAAAEITTVLYAADVALVSAGAPLLHAIAVRDRLFRHPPSPRRARAEVLDQCVPTFVFVVSIPVALVVSPTAGRYCWFAVLLLAPLSGRRVARLPDEQAPAVSASGLGGEGGGDGATG